MGFLAATLEMGYFQFMFDIEKSSKTDLFLRFCVYLAISIGGLIVNFNFGFVLLLCALYGVLTVSGYVLALFLFLFQCCTQPSLIFRLTYGAISLGIMKASDAGEVEYGQAAASV